MIAPVTAPVTDQLACVHARLAIGKQTAAYILAVLLDTLQTPVCQALALTLPAARGWTLDSWSPIPVDPVWRSLAEPTQSSLTVHMSMLVGMIRLAAQDTNCHVQTIAQDEAPVTPVQELATVNLDSETLTACVLETVMLPHKACAHTRYLRLEPRTLLLRRH